MNSETHIQAQSTNAPIACNREDIPWIEKYRPDTFDNIILNNTNKNILENIIRKNVFPNLLLYGPPGTGKTTTIINLIKSYQIKYNGKQDKKLIIHLNASDDRGIDIIRNQIYQFVNTNNFFSKGRKFVILDEVDYMTKNAQQALKNLVQEYMDNVIFCLICNYVSRIDTSLKHEFIKLQFSKLPEKKIVGFLKNIAEKEQLIIKNVNLKYIQRFFKNDVRCMINYMQTNLIDNSQHNIKIITKKIWGDLISLFKNKKLSKTTLSDKISTICIDYNIEITNLITHFFIYLFEESKINISWKNIETMEFIISNISTNKYIINYLHNSFSELYKDV